MTDGIERAREAAGEKEVQLAGGGQIVSQYLAAGVVDEIQVHIAPVEVLHSPRATHIRYRRAPH